MNEVMVREKAINQIVSRPTGPEFHTFDVEKLNKIAAGMPEIHRATRVFGRKNTQTTNRLMTLTMLADASPYRVVRQCLAQIEGKRQAIKDNRFRLIREQIRVRRDKAKLLNTEDEFERELIELKIEERESGISDSILYIEGALKDLASFQSSYLQICKNKGLPLEWDEEDMERAEVQHHLRLAFLHAYRDLMAKGRLGMGTLEYLQQMGVHPQTALEQTTDYVNSVQGVSRDKDYEHLECWLDDRVEENKENYKQVLARIGIDDLYETWYQYTEEVEDGSSR